MTDATVLTASPRLLDQVRGKIRLKHYSIRTEQAYLNWIKRFICHFGKRHPNEMGAREVEAFLTWLAVEGRVAASTQIGSGRASRLTCTQRRLASAATSGFPRVVKQSRLCYSFIARCWGRICLGLKM